MEVPKYNPEARKVEILAKCEVCEWSVKLPTDVIKLAFHSLILKDRAQKHMEETGHIVKFIFVE